MIKFYLISYIFYCTIFIHSCKNYNTFSNFQQPININQKHEKKLRKQNSHNNVR